MNQVKFAGGWDCQEVQRASNVSPIWYFSLIPVILGFSSGRSKGEKNRSNSKIGPFHFQMFHLPTTCMCADFIKVRNVVSATTSQL